MSNYKNNNIHSTTIPLTIIGLVVMLIRLLCVIVVVIATTVVDDLCRLFLTVVVYDRWLIVIIFFPITISCVDVAAVALSRRCSRHVVVVVVFLVLRMKDKTPQSRTTKGE